MSKTLYTCVIVTIILGGIGSVLTIPLVNGHKLNDQENQRAIAGIILIALAASSCMLGCKVIDNEKPKTEAVK